MKTRQQIISELQSSVTTLLASVKQNIFDNNVEYISGNRLQVELIEIINQLAQRVLDIANSYLNEDSDADVYSSYRRLFVVSQLLNLTTGTIPIGDVVSSQPTGNNIANFGDVAINTGDGVAYVFTSAQPNAWIPFDSILPITASSLISVTDGNAITVEASQILISSGITLTDNGAGVASISSVLFNASESVEGVVQEATQVQVNSGTDIGSTGARLFVSPSKLVTSTGSIIPNAVYVNPSHALASDSYTYTQARQNPNRPVSSFQRACDIAGANTIVVCESVTIHTGDTLIGSRNIFLLSDVTLTINRPILFHAGNAVHIINIYSNGTAYINLGANKLVRQFGWGAGLRLTNIMISGTGRTWSAEGGNGDILYSIILKDSTVTEILTNNQGGNIHARNVVFNGGFYLASAGQLRTLQIYNSLFLSSVGMDSVVQGLIYNCGSTGVISNSVGVVKVNCNENIGLISF
jgi:hypothetical protein